MIRAPKVKNSQTILKKINNKNFRCAFMIMHKSKKPQMTIKLKNPSKNVL